MRQSLSIWKSHGDTSIGRRKIRRPHRRHYSTDSLSEDEEDVDEKGECNKVEDEDDDDAYFEPPIHTKVTTWSGKSDKMCQFILLLIMCLLFTLKINP